eukprot:TRINITY_DN10066_c0_g1_i1.p1 TRINITY_DN10066_c0_g1~~TRINITY_DN10066_c0_g1_i1.p1  ORF type:complete len:591 (-),score=136.17 TRINITY_DN10066_c0_g1_i1:217-1989(-)
MDLHDAVPPDRWCVTRADLRSLRQLVQEAVQSGTIVPTAFDEFDPQDDAGGPNIYTVVEQFIKPETKKAGSMSWALMLHKNGLPCDVFITHSWKEGVFEFIDKVLVSWKVGARHAWCCMLANPQNLDIASLIRSPKESPFAKALMAARSVLVVPNSKVSTYSRLWCSYEAYLAYSQNKLIYTARRPLTREIALALCWLLVFLVLGCSARFLHYTLITEREHIELKPWMWFAPIVLTLLLSPCCTDRRRMNRGSMACIGFVLCGICVGDRYSSEDPTDDLRFTIVALLFFCLAEIDREKFEQAAEETMLLREGYPGSILHASCSVDRDGWLIRKEIGDHVAAVDAAVHVLMEACMSTPSLRQAAEQGVDLAREAVPNAALALLGLAFGVFATTPTYEAIDFVTTGFAVAWIIVMVSSSRDRRTFAVAALAKMMIMTFLIVILQIMLVSGCRDPIQWDDLCFTKVDRVRKTLVCASWVPILFVSTAGVGSVAQIPLVGPFLAQIIVAREGKQWKHACHLLYAACVRPSLSVTAKTAGGLCAGVLGTKWTGDLNSSRASDSSKESTATGSSTSEDEASCEEDVPRERPCIVEV